MSCARNQILQMLVRLTGPPRPRVSAAALNSSPILTEQIIMGTMRYSRIEPAFPPPKRTPRIRMASPMALHSSATVGKNAEHDRHGDCDLLRQVKPLHSGHEFADGCGRDYEVPHDNSRRKPEEQPHNGNRDKICNPGQIG